MPDSTVNKIDSKHSPHGEMGQKYLASGKHVSMRLWEAVMPGAGVHESERDYETVGYVISGKARLHLGEQIVVLNEGNSWIVPEHTRHHYEILEPFTAVEATSPPSQVRGRDHLNMN